MKKKKISNQEAQRMRVPDFVRLFWFAKKVSKHIGRKKSFALLEEYVTKKRLTWLKTHRDEIKKVKGTPIERAVKIFYTMNQQLSLKDAKIVKKDKNIIITRWCNYCPVLEACIENGLDTRQICKKIYHTPNQVFLSKIHPKLRFRRNYKHLRPHVAYCEEIIELVR